MTNMDFGSALAVMRKLVWGNVKIREKLQGHGLNLIPSNFYSNTPSIADIVNSYEYSETSPSYLDRSIFNDDFLRAELAELIPYSRDFEPPEHGDEETCQSYFWKNSQFSYSDAMSYYAYIRRIRPKTVLEIGSGFSSLIAVEALRANGQGVLKCIEPFPRPFLTTLGRKGDLELIKVRAQDISPEKLDTWLCDGDILFIDSTHTVKTGSDCLHIYLRMLPRIRKKIHIHVHDIFLPFGMPQKWLLESQIYWTEQYLLMAWMIDNPRVKVKFGSAWHQHFNPELLDRFMHGRCTAGGGSFWIEYDGRREEVPEQQHGTLTERIATNAEFMRHA